MSHLLNDELVRWRDRGAPEDRETVLAHLAACGGCRERYAGLVRWRPAPAAPASVDVQEFVRRGHATYAKARPRARWPRLPPWSGLGTLAAAAAVLALAAVVPVLLREPTSSGGGVEVRGDIQLLEPVGAVDSVRGLRWVSPVRAARYRVEIREREDVVFSTVADRSPLPAPPELRARLEPGRRYAWTVMALDGDGEVIMASPQRSFVVNRLPP